MMALHPGAQEEVDRIIGDNHLPSFSDREKLPYINALVEEIFRWETTVPIGPFASSSLPILCDFNYYPYSHTTYYDGGGHLHGLSHT